MSTPGTSSARPDRLDAYAVATMPIAASVEVWARQLGPALNAARAHCVAGRVIIPELDRDLLRIAGRLGEIGDFVKRV
ncbi:MAG: hypothetical protein QOE63_572, partial [Acidimicrobiaceae bacterium]